MRVLSKKWMASFGLLAVLALVAMGCAGVAAPVEVVKEVPVEVVREVPVDREVIKEVPVDREVIKEVPVEVVKEVPVDREVIKEVPVEVVKEVPVEVVATPTPAPLMAEMEPFVIGAMDAVTGPGESYGL